VETAQGLIKSPRGLFSKQTVNRWLSRWRLEQPRLLREPPAVRFQAENSNDCWQFDMSPSDLKHIERPDWVDPARGEPTLMLFSVVDDRSGVAYQEYRCVYGEDAESALRFLFNAMAPKTRSDFPFQGRPKMLYLDNGPVAKSHVFQNVMRSLKIDWLTHTPAGKDGSSTTARSKGKVERPSRRRMKPCTISINRKRSSRPTNGSGTIRVVTMRSATVARNTPDWRTGWQISPGTA
jgi:transposase InsO family protein